MAAHQHDGALAGPDGAGPPLLVTPVAFSAGAGPNRARRLAVLVLWLAAIVLGTLGFLISASGTDREPVAVVVALAVGAWLFLQGRQRRQMTSSARLLDVGPLAPVHLVPTWTGGWRRRLWFEVRGEDGTTVGWFQAFVVVSGFDPTVPFLLAGVARPGRRVALRSVDGRQLLLPATPLLRRPGAPAHPQSALIDHLVGWTAATAGRGIDARLRAAAAPIARRRGLVLGPLVGGIVVATFVVTGWYDWPDLDRFVVGIVLWLLLGRLVLRLLRTTLSRPLTRAVREVTSTPAADAAYVASMIEAFCIAPVADPGAGVTPAVPPSWAGMAAPATATTPVPPTSVTPTPTAATPTSVPPTSATPASVTPRPTSATPTSATPTLVTPTPTAAPVWWPDRAPVGQSDVDGSGWGPPSS